MPTEKNVLENTKLMVLLFKKMRLNQAKLKLLIYQIKISQSLKNRAKELNGIIVMELLLIPVVINTTAPSKIIKGMESALIFIPMVINTLVDGKMIKSTAMGLILLLTERNTKELIKMENVMG